MRGVITGREVAYYAGLIRREFGARCLARCLWALVRGEPTTFLELAWTCPRDLAPSNPWITVPANCDQEAPRH
jgi:hypothetical protein